MKTSINEGLFTVWATSILCGALVVPIDFLLSLKAKSLSFVPAALLAFRSCGWYTLVVAVFTGTIFILLRILDRAKPGLFGKAVQQAIVIGTGVFITASFFLFNRFYNKFEALLVVQIIGGAAGLTSGWLGYLLLRSSARWDRLATRGRRTMAIGTLGIVVLFAISFPGLKGARRTDRSLAHGSNQSDRPNILLIVLDTVRADHLSLYGYERETTPFLEIMARESAVFDNAFAASPWTLPSHATLFTGLYPSQHNTHGEHFWLDDSYRTLAEILREAGYQTVCFSNNDYVSSFHNLVQGFERVWYKGSWTDDIRMLPHTFGGSLVAASDWFWKEVITRILIKVVENPASFSDYPNAALTNNGVSNWLRHGRDASRPFFMFINYMDAHMPYNPDDETARLFFDDTELKATYDIRLRFPPLEYWLDLSKGQYSQREIIFMTKLYDACIRYLDGELSRLYRALKNQGILDKTLIIITSDHGEYLGTRNRLAHGLGLHEELLHIPLIARYPTLFTPAARYDTVVTHVDITETILSFTETADRPEAWPETQVLYDLEKNRRSNVYAESRFPLNLLINAPLRQDHSHLFVEQKAIRDRFHQFTWKSRGTPEFYDLAADPLQIKNLYSLSNREAQVMGESLSEWAQALCPAASAVTQESETSEKVRLELRDRLRALGYTN
jgi:arylsulfatase A-like enzyme